MLEEAIDRGDWPHALELALEAWRTQRLPELADLIDALAARCAVPRLHHTKASKDYQVRWLELARVYDPIAVTALALDPWTRTGANDQRFPEIRATWGDDHPVVAAIIAAAPTWFDTGYVVDHMNLIARIVAIWRWPDDPRTAAMLAQLLSVMPLQFQRRDTLDAIYRLAADRLVELRDVRVLPVLEGCIDEPRAQTVADREVQRRLAKEVLDRIAHPARDRDAVEAASRLVATIAPPPPAVDFEALWREVAAHPDDDAPRLVLADALTEAGDPRGEMIALQIAGGTHNLNLAARIWKRELAKWLGDLALAVTRKGTEFRRGMLEVVRAGHLATPAWLWPKLEGHRELATVHTVEPGHVTPADYALLLRALPNVRTITVDAPTVFDTMRPCPTATTLRYRQDNPTIPRPLVTALVRTFTAAARVLPNLEAIGITTAMMANDLAAQLGAVVELAPQWFPRLRAIQIPEIFLRRDATVLTALRTHPLVRLT